MEEALGSRGKNPVSEFCRWNDGLKVHVLGAGTSSLFDRDSRYNLSDGATPLVYHLYGDMDIRASMVLTKKDYIDFIINLNRETRKQYSHLLSVKH